MPLPLKKSSPPAEVPTPHDNDELQQLQDEHDALMSKVTSKQLAALAELALKNRRIRKGPLAEESV
jgi:hypothetical protein